MDEQTTRKTLIDKALEAAGWSPIVRYLHGASYDTAAVEEYETTEGPADYILFHRGDALGAVEAKKLSLGPQNVLSQAQRYVRGFHGGRFSFHGFRLPFVYSTNGEIIWFRDYESPEFLLTFSNERREATDPAHGRLGSAEGPHEQVLKIHHWMVEYLPR